MTTILSAAAIVASAWALLIALLFTGQRSFLYFPDTCPPERLPLVVPGLVPHPVRAGEFEVRSQPQSGHGPSMRSHRALTHTGHALFQDMAKEFVREAQAESYGLGEPPFTRSPRRRGRGATAEQRPQSPQPS
jgi:hypothetical protein